jgi:probable HAF family extracellular repeat protein
MSPDKGDSIAYDMNTDGQVAAVLQDENGDQHAVLYDRTELIQIGTLGGNQSDARRINKQGEVVGSANRKNGTWGAYLYSRAGGILDLGTLGGANSHGTAINNRGDVVGFSDLANDEWHAFVYRAGESLKDLGTLGGKVSYASAINNRGQIVGTATVANNIRHAFIYDDEHGMVDLGTLGGRASYAASINDKGIVVGASETENHDWHAFVFDGRKMIDLGTLFGQWDSFPVSINNVGHVVGSLKLNDNHLSFVWHDGVMSVHRSGVTGLYQINSINDAGIVIGATYGAHLSAATMLYSTIPPQKDEISLSTGDSYLINRLLLVLVTVGVLIIFSGRYKGIVLRR